MATGLIVLTIQLSAIFLYPRRHSRGYLSRWALPFFMKRFSFFGPSLLRLSQILACWILIPSNKLYFIAIAILYIDDVLFGDDDQTKKRWESVKNRIKWKMELPAPIEGEVAS